MELLWIDAQAELAELVRTLAGEPRYALDTEFHGERSYWPHLALIQIAWPEGVALVDPLTVDPAPLGELLAGDGCMVAHAADQDLTILERACGCAPSKLFDTQVAAGFIGMGTPSLAATVEKLLGTRLTKGDRLTDWTRRPLSADQRVNDNPDAEDGPRRAEKVVGITRCRVIEGAGRKRNTRCGRPRPPRATCR